MIKRPVYNRDIDGPDVFGWILEAAHVYRELKKQEREEILGKPAPKTEVAQPQEGGHEVAKRSRKSNTYRANGSDLQH